MSSAKWRPFCFGPVVINWPIFVLSCNDILATDNKVMRIKLTAVKSALDITWTDIQHHIKHDKGITLGYFRDARQAFAAMMVADVLVPNRRQATSNHHADFSATMVIHENLYHAPQPINEQCHFQNCRRDLERCPQLLKGSGLLCKIHIKIHFSKQEFPGVISWQLRCWKSLLADMDFNMKLSLGHRP